MEREVLRGASSQHRVVAGNKLPAVRGFVVDGQAVVGHGNGNLLRLTGSQLDAGPADETLGRLAGRIRQRSVHLGNLCSGALAGVLHREGNGEPITALHGQPGVGVGGVGEAEAEREQDGFLLRVVPLVADL